MSFGGPVGALIGLLLADRVGRKPVIILASLSAAVFAAIYPFAAYGPAVTLVGFCMITSIYVFVAVGVALRVPELFPTPIRLRGTGLANLAGRITATVVQFGVVWLFSTGGIAGVIAAIVAVLVLQTVIIALCDRETRRQSLEEIADADLPATTMAAAVGPAE
jgi:putative MFS transporter